MKASLLRSENRRPRRQLGQIFIDCQSALRAWIGPAAVNSARPALLCLGILCFSIGGLQQVAAQPKITVQPRNAAVQPGQFARFTVTVSGRIPLTYQWWFDRGELAGATNRILTVTNVASSNLGRYAVVVRDSTGTVTSAPAWLLLASRWTELVVFGASWELQECEGLLWPEFKYVFVWPDYLANRLGVRLRNYAQEGAGTAEVRSQITGYLRSNTPTTNTLVGHWGGGSFHDVRGGLSAESAASNRLAHVRLLANAGARNLLIPTMVPPEMLTNLVARFPKFTSEQVIEFDARVSEGLNALQAEYALTIYRPDTFALFMAIRENPAAHGFSVHLGSDFTCDGGHFTAAVHRLMSQELYRSLTPTVRIDSAVQTLSGDVAIHWSGGSPPFRIERTSNLLSGQWETAGELDFLPSATVKREGPHEFFRVLFLGQ